MIYLVVVVTKAPQSKEESKEACVVLTPELLAEIGATELLKLLELKLPKEQEQ